MNKLYFCKINGRDKGGLCNQLYALINGIIIAIKLNKEIIIVDNFKNDYNKEIYTPISKIIHIDEFNKFLQKMFNIQIVDKNNMEFKLNTIYYGSDECKINITQNIMEQFYSNNILSLSKDINLIIVAGEDPIPFVRKSLFICYSINNIILEEIFEEVNCYLINDIMFNFNIETIIFKHTFLSIDVIDKNMFDKLIKNIIFNDKFYNLVDNFLIANMIDTNNKINVLHLRLEQDGLEYWGKSNNLQPSIFKTNLEQKYIEYIKTNISKDEINIILSYSTQNKVINFLRDQGYKFHLTNKTLDEGREINALIDLIVGNVCNNVFIGNFNLDVLTGSGFSYCLIQALSQREIKMALIDLEKIL